MRLHQLLADVDVLHLRGDPATVEISAVNHDSRSVTPGALFCCVRGRYLDGHDMALHAVAAGASALLCERHVPVDVAQVVVPATRPAMAQASSAFFGHPSRQLSAVGVTGTNGKTTTTHLVKAVLEAAGNKTGLIGTLSGIRTTPEAPEFQSRLAEMVAEGAVAAAVEVSSHALAQHRVDGTWFSVVAFTNLSPEHLDFHVSMEDYFEAKASLFHPARAAVAVVNVDDPWGRRLADSPRLPTTPYSLADASDLELGPTWSTFNWRNEPVKLGLGGEFNVLNALGAAAIASELGVDAPTVAAGLSSAPSVPGRFEAVEAGQPFLVVVDYAHTPASLEQVLVAARRAAGAERVIAVFGCGGDRDSTKRPQMGAVATRLADLAILTSDNPRNEDPTSIIGDVRAGVERPEVLVVEPDRRSAISLGIRAARRGDVVVIAGKGHETAQIVGDQTLPFDDREVALEVLRSTEW